ncbi:hypothetical protein SAMN05421538_107120 [Paracoccus isoporae]|uniref:Uncharacterized protein n=1 Tax=Paracoccus isoporae TaxID=591205 RepID=A0A1G7DKB6_9RHOB|nr:hypothetical protein [Paracoccus isoporae]SDE51500.1 hypothetical protein SAMN05421538_107120 [Paracoccus isoporae]
MFRRLTLALLPLAILAGCGTPQERCIRGNTREYRALSRLLAETEANLARGYAWQERDVVRTRITICQRPVRDKDGEIRYVSESCWRDYVDTERYRVPIDPAAERRVRDNLAAKLEVQEARARQVVSQCRAAYPEEAAA